MKKKFTFDIEVQDSNRISGGYIETVTMTEKQVVAEMTYLGKELLRNNENIDKVKYSAWEADNNDYENAVCAFVIVKRVGKRFSVYSY